MVRILIVEDEKVVAWHIRVALEKLGHVVVASVISGRQAIQTAEETKPDLILMDVRLRGKMTGIAAAEQIYSRFDIPVIFLTAYTDTLTVQQAIASSPFGYLAKPLRTQDLQNTIQVTLHRHQQEQSLKRTQQWLATLLTSIGDGTIATNLEGNVTFINPVAEQLTGWQQQEAVGQPITQIMNLLHADTQERAENPLLQAVQQDMVIRLEADMLLRAKDGTERRIGDSAAPIKNTAGETMGGILIFQDHTEATDPNLPDPNLPDPNLPDPNLPDPNLPDPNLPDPNLPDPNSQLQTRPFPRATPLPSEPDWRERLQANFLSALSDELRTPLTNMRMAAEMLERIATSLQNADGNAEVEQNKALLWHRMEQYLQLWRDAWQQEFNLINRLLELQQVELSLEPLTLTAVDLAQWLPELIDRFTAIASQKRQTLTYQISPLLPVVQSHLLSLEQVMTELLTNACTYTPPQQQILVTAEVADNQLRLVVVNTGIEIPTDQLQLIFQPLYRVPRPPSWNDTGAGLGLTLVKKLVTRLGGEIHCESEAQQTRFIVVLPFVRL